MESLISVIVPVYKVEKYLTRCVESICQQTYANIEIILVDDGSPDSCPQMCDNFAAKDPRIQVIHKPNGGLSDARNAGIEIAAGEYLLFVDSDDYIAPTMLEHLFDTLRSAGTSLAIADIRTVDEFGQLVFTSEESPIRPGSFQASELLPRLYHHLGWYYIVAWNKLYHRSLFDNLRFPVGKIHEDEYIIAQILMTAGTVTCCASQEYIYTYQRAGSIMSSKQVQSHCDWLEALYLRFQYCKSFPALASFTAETRALYFTQLNKLILDKHLRAGATASQRRKATEQYAAMDGKTRTERINWFLFRISPHLDHSIVKLLRSIGGLK